MLLLKTVSTEPTKKKKKRTSQLVPSQDALQSLFEKSEIFAEQFQRWKLAQSWEKIIGSRIGAVTRPIDCREGVMTVWVKNAVWRQELRFFEELIIQKVNEYAGHKWVRELRWTVGDKF